MKNFIKGKFGTVIILLFTVILAGVAIFTALRLYQLRSQPVAPNVPSSIPRAQEVTPPPSPGACTLSFTIIPQTPGLNCTGKLAYIDDSRNTPGVYYLDPENNITPGSNVTPGQTFLYVVDYKNTGAGTANSAIITDVLPANVSFKDAGNGCTYVSSTRTITCNLGNVVAGVASQKAIRVTILASATSGSFTNNAVVSGTGVTNSECQIALNVQASSASPTPTASPTGTPGPSATPNSCGGTCGSNSNCGSGFYCYTGFCRNPSCPTQVNCACPGTTAPTPTPTAPALPVSGTDWPTVVGAGIGIFVILGSLLLAL